ncbi:MAG TPA: hypothetical protein VER55_10750 [Ardenticatenaceae bacterium]|nr:hypothetical protein [Ardenticatenaceae bacterium]
MLWTTEHNDGQQRHGTARAVAETGFDWGRLTDELEALYRQVLAQSGAAGGERPESRRVVV